MSKRTSVIWIPHLQKHTRVISFFFVTQVIAFSLTTIMISKDKKSCTMHVTVQYLPWFNTFFPFLCFTLINIELYRTMQEQNLLSSDTCTNEPYSFFKFFATWDKESIIPFQYLEAKVYC